MTKSLKMHLLNNWSEIQDGLITVVNQGEFVLDAAMYSDGPADVLFEVTVYKHKGQAEVLNASYMHNFNFEDYQVIDKKYFQDASDMYQFQFEFLEYNSHLV